MANRFWVGGAGTWNTTSTTNWSASSGGGGGASVPTVADSVFFDQAGTYTVTMTGALACLDITVSAGTVTFATGTSPTLEIRGSMSLLAGTVWSFNGLVTFTSTATGRIITTNGVLISGFVIFSGVGGGWTLGSAFTSAGFALNDGTFDTSVSNYALTTTAGGGFQVNSNRARTLNLNASTVTVNIASASGFQATTIAGLTFNAGTSQINLTAATAGISSGGLTFYNVSFTSTATGTRTITGVNTFNNLTVAGPASAGVVNVTFDSQQTINGTLSTTGTAGNRRVFFTTANYGISRDLVVNSAPSLTDADFRGLYVRGTSAPISGTRIGNRGECRGITFDTPKTVYWNLAAGGNWSSNAWALSAGGGVSTDNFPLPQDTATIVNTGLNVSAIIQLDSLVTYIGTIDMSGRTNAMTLALLSAYTIYGNWINGAGVSFTNTQTQTFSGGTTQTITSAGKAFTCPITVNTYGGTVQLADALNIGTQSLTVTNGTFSTAGYAVNIGNLGSSNSNVRTINLGASTVTITSTVFPISLSAVNLAFNAGTSTVAITYNTQGFGTVDLAGVTFYNFNFLNTNSNEYNLTFSGVTSTFNNLSFSFPNGTILAVVFQANHIINGTLTCAGASAIRRVFLNSSVIGTPRTLTVNSISAADCDFRDITLAGTASGASPTRAGDCGGNTGITFPAPKTVYWNLAGTQNWSATGWATSSGGTPAVNNFPLAHDTVVFDNSGAIGTIRINGPWNIGTFDASLRTSSMTINGNFKLPVVYGDWKSGTGLTWVVDSSLFTFAKNGTQTITSNGVQFGCDLAVNNRFANVQLADALSLNALRTLTLTAGTFDAVTYNVTTGLFVCNGATGFLRMGSGTWTISGTGSTWLIQSIGALFAGTSTIVLSNTSTSARTFQGGSFYYNKLTIGGATGTSTLTIDGSGTFGELASTKTVAHTIAFFGSNTVTFGKWSVTGTAGNVVTITGTSTTNVIAGPAVTGVDYLAMGTWGISTTSPGEFYAGANSTGTAAAPVFRTAAPTPRTLYWVGGTGNWSSTTKWSTSSGGGSGAAIPTSLDAVVFDSASNATAYTATIDAGVTLARCASFTMAGPASGNVTFAGTVPIAFHGNVSFAATGITRTYTGTMNWAGNSSYTFTSNGVTFAGGLNVTGINSTWTLGGSFTNSNSLTACNLTFGTFNTSTSSYAVSFTGHFTSAAAGVRSLVLNNSTCTFISSVSGGATAFNAINFTFDAGNSLIQIGSPGTTWGTTNGPLAFYNVSFTSAAAASMAITGANTFNTLSFVGRSITGITPVTFNANQTITTLTLNAGTASAYRTFLASDTIGIQRTLNVTTLTAGAADIDFRDIAITGAAAPLTGTRFGDAKGNSGITFPAAKTVYWALSGTANWGSGGSGSWSATSGGSAAADQFPLAQDTAYIPFAVPNNNQTITVNAAYNIGTLDMNERNGSALLTLATGTTTPAVYGNWTNGTGTTLTSSASVVTFSGRNTQTFTSAGKTTPQFLTINSPNGTLLLGDAFVGSFTIDLTSGTFNTQSYSVTIGDFVSTNSNIRAVNLGSSGVVLTGTSTVWNASTSAGLTVTGAGTISLTSASGKSFAGGGANYSGITLNQGGAGTLTIIGNNTFKDITNTRSAIGAATIAMGNTTQTVTQWSGTGASGKVLTLSGTSAASPATLIISGAVNSTTDYLNISNVRGYPLNAIWKIGANSTNAGSLGFFFETSGGNVYNVTVTDAASGADAISALYTTLASIIESATGTEVVSGGLLFTGNVSESATGSDADAGRATFKTIVVESAAGADLEAAILSALARINETGAGSDSVAARYTARSNVAETGTITDAAATKQSARSNVAETATVTDAASALATLLAAVSEAATATDLTESIKALFAYIVESATALDALNAPGSTYNPRLTETAAATDSLSALAIFAAQLAEAATAADVVSAFKAYLAAIIETAAITDSASPRYIANPAVSETAAGTDTDSAQMTVRPLISESAAGADAAATSKTTNPSVTETAAATDTDSAKYTTQPSISETAAGTDALNTRATFRSAVIDSGVVQDIVRATQASLASISELTTGSDQITARRALAVAIVESIFLYEGSIISTSYDTPGAGTFTVPAGTIAAVIELWGGGGGGDEGTASGDGSGGGGGAYAKKTLSVTPGTSLSFVVGSGGTGGASFPYPYTPVTPGTASTYSTITAGGGAAAGAGGTASGGDINISGSAGVVTAGGTAGGPGGGISDTSPGGGGSGGVYSGGFYPTPGNSGLSGRVRFSYSSGTPTASVDFASRLNEAGVGADTINAPGSTYSAPVVELSVLLDVLLANATFPVSVTEAATGSQTNSAAFIPYARITESATITDVASALAAFAARTAESASAADAVLVAPSVFNAVALASAQAVDNFNPAGSVYNAPVLESATISDSLIGGFLWNLINDDQAPNWGPVNNVQAATWTAIDDDQSVTWVKVSAEDGLNSYWAAASVSPDAAIMFVGGSNSTYIRTTGGQAEIHTLPVTGSVFGTYYVNGYFFVFGGTNFLLQSVDGLNWTRVTLPVTNRSVGTVFGNGTQLGIIQNDRVYISTDNGATWTGGDTGFFRSPARADCIWDGTKYVLADGNKIRTSTNGFNWTNVTGRFIGYDRGCLFWDGTTYMCLFASWLGVNFHTQLLRSTNGTTWTSIPLPLDLIRATNLFLAGSEFAVVNAAGAFYTTQAPTFTFTQKGTAPNYTFPSGPTISFAVAKFKGKYYIPGIGTVEMTSKFLTTIDLVTFDINSVTTWGIVDDTQSPNWQNIQTMN